MRRPEHRRLTSFCGMVAKSLEMLCRARPAGRRRSVRRYPSGPLWSPAAEVFFAFLKLGLTSFGGPVAHLGYFRAEFVERRGWLSEATYADILALCQFLPGPASSQVGITLGLMRAGAIGALAAWAGFTMPSALALILFARIVVVLRGAEQSAWLHGFRIVAVAVVAQAVFGMASSLCPDRPRITLAAGAALLALAGPSAYVQIAAIVLGALIGWRLLPADSCDSGAPFALYFRRGISISALVVFFGLLFGLPLVRAAMADHTIALADGFFRSGALVFGGGHVVLPLLQKEVVPPGWIGNDLFLAGYAAAQAVPGPLFTFAAYLGAVMPLAPNGLLGGLLCLAAIYLPSFLLLIGILPFWEELRRRASVRSALNGANAAVVGLLLAALYSPIWSSAIFGPSDFAIALSLFVLLMFWRTPPWVVVALGAIGTAAIARLA
jgi:chromate transporter